MESKTITSLTKEQEALMPVYRDKWIATGLAIHDAANEAANKIGVEKCITEMYVIIEKAAPIFHWFAQKRLRFPGVLKRPEIAPI